MENTYKDNFYSEEYERGIPGHGWLREKIIESRFRAIHRNLPCILKNKNYKILEVGCDEGILLKKFEKQFNMIGYGVELNSRAVVLANHSRITEGKAEELKFNNDFFDICIASHLIEHLSSPQVFVEEAARVLKTDGYLVLIYPWELFPGMTTIPDLLKSRQPLKLMKKLHQNCFQPSSLKKLISDLSLKHIRSKLFWGFPYITPQYLSIFSKTNKPNIDELIK